LHEEGAPDTTEDDTDLIIDAADEEAVE